MRVLYVEDTEINRRILREMLSAVSIDMAEAEDGEAGLRKLDAEDYDLVFMDLRMPGMDGLTAIRHIRARGDAKAQVPVIVITADSRSNLEADCHAAGADEMMEKPVSMPTLFATIERVMSRRQDSQALAS